MRRWILLAAATVTAVGSFVFLFSGYAEAHFNWNSDYMYRASNCTNQADPINLFFYGAGDLASSQVEVHMGWDPITQGDEMYVLDHGECVPASKMEQLESPHPNPPFQG